MKVLDKGSLDIVDSMGSDKTVVNTARVSFANDDWSTTLPGEVSVSDKDAKLINYLANNGHVSPFYHPHVIFRFRAPISVQRQLVTHRVGTSMNSESTRYTEIKREFYIPNRFRKQATTNRQGSSEELFDEWDTDCINAAYLRACNEAFNEYEYMIKKGVAKELAREVLPLATYTSWIFTMSLAAVAHFIRLRTEEHAQEEIKMYAHAMRVLATPLFPVSLKALLGET